MTYILMNTDKPVLKFDNEFTYIEVIDNQFLPFMLKDYIQTTSMKDFNKALKDINCFRDFLAARTLNLSRENAKTILNVAALPQSIKTGERLKITLACRGLNMEDNFWIKEETENIKFSDVNLRNRRLSENSYDIAIIGNHISATRDELMPDLMLGGMFPKYWHRNTDNGAIELWKTDKVGGLNSICEAEASEYIIKAGGNSTPYHIEKKDGLTFSVSKCFTDDKYSLVKATDVMDWCNHTDKDLMTVLKPYMTTFADMVISDYILGNTDRHFDNWGFLIDNDTNAIFSLAPIYDLNQALVIDKLGKNEVFDDLIYEPISTSFKEAADRFYKYADLDFSGVKLPDGADKRFNRLKELCQRKINDTKQEENEAGLER